MKKLKIGILFGGPSREREISFAGGRTVYDNLDKSLFEPIPLFIDSLGNFILLKWELLYKGSIRDFYPPIDIIPPSPNNYQIYIESLSKLSNSKQNEVISKIGKRISVEELKELIDFAFLCLHGSYGEDGRIQGLLEYIGIPYSGSGIISSAIGINKSIQKDLIKSFGFAGPKYTIIKREIWLTEKDKSRIFEKVKEQLSFPLVVKSANQGSSIGVSVINDDSLNNFTRAIDKSLFIHQISRAEWNLLKGEEKIGFVRSLTDIREGIGLPVIIKRDGDALANQMFIYHPEDILNYLNDVFTDEGPNSLIIEAFEGDSEVIIEEFIYGKEFSCIVIQDEAGKPIALPPTEIKKGKELFDYRSKYLPGLSRKVTPIDLPESQIEAIRSECERLFEALHFNVYARIDGFIQQDGLIFLNDPNTTSGMMPSSFFFHQAAEIGLNPSQFLTYIIRTSVEQRVYDFKNYSSVVALLRKLDTEINKQKNKSEKIKVAVILGGYSTERHISVESGRNIYEKLSSSEKYEAVPIFLTGDQEEHYLFQIPINILLKDNADDIKEKVDNYRLSPVVKKIINECSAITRKYASSGNLNVPKSISYEELKEMVDGVFIALHGRPGEDGVVQSNLEKVGLSYNGSGVSSSRMTIDKYETNEILRKNGFSVAKHILVHKDQWENNRDEFVKNVLKDFTFPFIVKPVDDGCSSAVKKIKNEKELIAFAELIFRNTIELEPIPANILQLKLNEEFPKKQSFLIEELITKNGASHFLEITGGLLTHFNEKGEIIYEIFEASEALSEGDVLSLEEKFLAGEGQNLTPARYAKSEAGRRKISEKVKAEFERVARILKVEGYARIDAFVRVFENNNVEVIFIEVNSLPGMTPATCIFHQSAINGYKPYEFIDKILEFGFQRKKLQTKVNIKV